MSFMTLFLFPDPGTGRRGQETGTLWPGKGRLDKRNKMTDQTPATRVRGRVARRAPFRLNRRPARRVLVRPPGPAALRPSSLSRLVLV